MSIRCAVHDQAEIIQVSASVASVHVLAECRWRALRVMRLGLARLSLSLLALFQSLSLSLTDSYLQCTNITDQNGLCIVHNLGRSR